MIPSPVSSLRSVFLHLFQKKFDFFFCPFYGNKNRMHRTALYLCNFLICKIIEIIKDQPSALCFRQLVNRPMELLILNCPIHGFFYRAGSPTAFAAPAFLLTVRTVQYACPTHFRERSPLPVLLYNFLCFENPRKFF